MHVHVHIYSIKRSSSGSSVAAVVRTSNAACCCLLHCCASLYTACLLYVYEYGLLLIFAPVLTPRLPLYGHSLTIFSCGMPACVTPRDHPTSGRGAWYVYMQYHTSSCATFSGAARCTLRAKAQSTQRPGVAVAAEHAWWLPVCDDARCRPCRRAY